MFFYPNLSECRGDLMGGACQPPAHAPFDSWRGKQSLIVQILSMTFLRQLLRRFQDSLDRRANKHRRLPQYTGSVSVIFAQEFMLYIALFTKKTLSCSWMFFANLVFLSTAALIRLWNRYLTNHTLRHVLCYIIQTHCLTWSRLARALCPAARKHLGSYIVRSMDPIWPGLVPLETKFLRDFDGRRDVPQSRWPIAYALLNMFISSNFLLERVRIFFLVLSSPVNLLSNCLYCLSCACLTSLLQNFQVLSSLPKFGTSF